MCASGFRGARGGRGVACGADYRAKSRTAVAALSTESCQDKVVNAMGYAVCDYKSCHNSQRVPSLPQGGRRVASRFGWPQSCSARLSVGARSCCPWAGWAGPTSCWWGCQDCWPSLHRACWRGLACFRSHAARWWTVSGSGHGTCTASSESFERPLTPRADTVRSSLTRVDASGEEDLLWPCGPGSALHIGSALGSVVRSDCTVAPRFTELKHCMKIFHRC